MGEPLLQAIGLWKSYRAGESTVRAISGISLDIKEGEFLAILGRSGSGKSTLLHILGLLARPDTGLYSLRGWRVENLGEDARAESAIARLDSSFNCRHCCRAPQHSKTLRCRLPMRVLSERSDVGGRRMRSNRWGWHTAQPTGRTNSRAANSSA